MRIAPGCGKNNVSPIDAQLRGGVADEVFEVRSKRPAALQRNEKLTQRVQHACLHAGKPKYFADAGMCAGALFECFIAGQMESIVNLARQTRLGKTRYSDKALRPPS